MTDEVERLAPGETARASGSTGRVSADEGGVTADLPLHPIAEALRKTFDADNHATLGRDVTGLMLDLSRVPFEPHEFEGVTPPLHAPAHRGGLPRGSAPQGWLARARLAVQRMRDTRG